MKRKSDSWFVRKLITLDACKGAIRYARQQRTFPAAWRNCEHVSWLIWLIDELELLSHDTDYDNCRRCKWNNQDHTLSTIRRRFSAERVAKKLRGVE